MRDAATIFALSSGAPPAAIGVVRISGPDAADVIHALAGRELTPRQATLVRLKDPENDVPIDDALTLWFPGPASATGEDLLELHCHGGRAVIHALEAALAKMPGLRPAQPGEFTRRAFENGRIDLAQAEGLADLLAAETESQRRAALAMSEGHFSRDVETWRRELLAISAMVEAALDFSDEDDVPGEGIEVVIADRIAGLERSVRTVLARPSAERLRDGVRVVIAGPPNAGKSTLLNRLVGRDAAIVSDIAGTTRDRIEVPAAINGVPFLFTDTAGLREAGPDPIEAIGMDRARDAITAADLVLWLGAPGEAPDGATRIAAQIDRKQSTRREHTDFAVSAVTGEGIDILIDHILAKAANLLPRESEYALGERQRRETAVFADALARGRVHQDLLIVAEELRQGRAAIDRITGRAGTEDMLDTLFSGFCIGK